MRPFKFFSGDPYLRSINRNLYETVRMTQPVVNAVMDSINYCNRTDTRYEDNEHYFDMSGRAFKLKVLDIRSYRNPVHSFFKIRYEMCLANLSLDEIGDVVINQLRLNEHEYQTLIRPQLIGEIQVPDTCYVLIMIIYRDFDDNSILNVLYQILNKYNLLNEHNIYKLNICHNLKDINK